tara:strand:- start:1449 stop:1934 length:486 start_codon:yes stop_codon:yes gene_type:complete
MHNKQNNKETRSFVQGLRPFSITLPRGVKSILKKNGHNYSEIINKWNSLVGKDIAKCCNPKSIKMKKGNSNGTLVVSVKRGDEITVEYSKNDIINKINSFFGYKLISELKLETDNKKLDKIKKSKKNNFSKNLVKKVEDVKNIKIKEALSQLLETVTHDKK